MFKKIFSAVRLRLKISFDNIRNEHLKKNLLQAIPFWLASVITGLTAVLYTKLFLLAEDVTALVIKTHSWFLFVFTPVCFVTSWWLVKQFSPYARGSGIPQVMAAIEISGPRTHQKVNKLLSLRIIFIK